MPLQPPRDTVHKLANIVVNVASSSEFKPSQHILKPHQLENTAATQSSIPSLHSVVMGKIQLCVEKR